MNVPRTYQFALIGCGRIAARHAPLIRRYGKLAAVCDTVEDRARSFAQDFGGNVYLSVDSMLDHEKNLDVLIVCTPNGLHAEHSIKALQRSIHVLCEKPMCLTTVAAYGMRDTAYFFRKKLFIVKQNRFNPPVRFAKKMQDEGKLGKILSIQLTGVWNRGTEYFKNSSWRGTAELDGGTLFTQFSHFIDLLLWFGGDVDKILAVEANLLRKNELAFSDTQVATVQFKSGALASLFFSINARQKNCEGSMLIVAEKGTIKIGGQYLNTLEYVSIEEEQTPSLDQGNPPNRYGQYEGSMSNHNQVYASLIEAIESKNNALVNAEEGLKTVAFIEQLYAAAEKQSTQ